jgi:multidrug resistance protein, MATE family
MALTRYEEGGIREVWHISFPLMLSFFSTFLMTFVDRLFLSHYSPEALSAAVNAGSMSWAPIFALACLASIAEVFIAQNNGAKKFLEIPKYVWPMIWLGVFSTFIYLPMSWWVTPILYSSSQVMERDYYSWMLTFAPVTTIVFAISAFYVGRGKTGVITLLTIAGNLVNVILDPLFIFGYHSFPSMGVKGAAIATGIGYCVQAAMLFYIFLRKKNRELYNTHKVHFDITYFMKCIKVGTPSACFITFELLGWGICYWMIAKTGELNMAIVSIAQSILFPFFSFGLGLEKGIAAIAGNLIGAGREYLIKKVITSGIILCSFFTVAIWVIFTGYPEIIINWFVHNPESLDHTTQITNSLFPYIKHAMIFLAIYLTFENLRWLFSGILMSAGDTYFLMFCSVLCVWLTLVFPVYIFVNHYSHAITLVYYSWISFSITTLLAVGLRYYSGSWRKKSLVNA